MSAGAVAMSSSTRAQRAGVRQCRRDARELLIGEMPRVEKDVVDEFIDALLQAVETKTEANGGADLDVDRRGARRDYPLEEPVDERERHDRP